MEFVPYVGRDLEHHLKPGRLPRTDIPQEVLPVDVPFGSHILPPIHQTVGCQRPDRQLGWKPADPTYGNRQSMTPGLTVQETTPGQIPAYSARLDSERIPLTGRCGWCKPGKDIWGKWGQN